MEQKHIDGFWRKVEVGKPGECWNWRASCASNGYGNAYNGRVLTAHRMSWEIHHGPIPEGQWVLHRCDNKKCVNPRHLYLGGVRENADDAMARGYTPRGEKHGSRRHPERVRRGEAHPATTLTDEQVMDMRRRWSAGEVSRLDLRREYGLKLGALANILEGRTWQHLPVLPKPAEAVRPLHNPAYVRMREATHCPKGHEYTPENTGKQQGRWRVCRACKAEWARQKRAKQKAEP